MKQSRINTYFSPGDLKAGASGSYMQPRRMNKPEKRARDWFYNKDPTVIYEKIREKERKQMKFNLSDHMGLECDLSSQNSSQMMFNSQLNSQNSQSFVGSSSHSEDTTTWYQSWMNRNQSTTSFYPQSRTSSRQSYPASSSEDFKQYMDGAKRRSKEKEEKDIISTFLTLVKECCEETKAAVTSNTEKHDSRVSEGFLTTFEKIENVVKKLDGIENLFESKKEYVDKIEILKRQLCESQLENTRLRQELDDVRKSAEHEVMEKLTEAFEKEKSIQSEKMEELASCASEIKSFLKKPKLTTADMWSQCSPRLPLLKPNEIFAPAVTTQTSPSPKVPSTSAALSSDCDATGKQPNGCLVSLRHRNTRSEFLSPIHRGATAVFEPHAFAAPMHLPPRYASAEFSQQHSSANLFKAANTLPGASGSEHSNFPTLTKNAFASPSFGGVRHMRKKNWISPVATVTPWPQQHCESTNPKQPVLMRNDSATISTNRCTWQDLAKNQSESWFARRTRSKTAPEEASATGQPPRALTTTNWDDSSKRLTAAMKPKPKKRRGPLSRKKGSSKRQSRLKACPVEGSEDLKRNFNAIGTEINFRTTSVRRALTNACNTTIYNSTPQIKQERRDTFYAPFVAAPKTADDPLAWIDLTDSGDESSGNDGINLVSADDHKENMESIYLQQHRFVV